MRAFFNPVLNLDVLLKFVSKGNTSFWLNAYLVVRSKRAEPADTAKPLWSCPACSPALQVCPWGLREYQKKPEVKCIY